MSIDSEVARVRELGSPASSCHGEAGRATDGVVRIGIDGNCLGHPFGGVARYVLGVLSGLRALCDAGVDPKVFTPSGVRRTTPWVLWHMQRVGFKDCDALHFPFYYSSLWPRCPSTVAIHDVLVIEHPEWFPRAWARATGSLLRWGSRRAAAVVTGSQAMALAIRNVCHVPCERIAVIPYGVDTVTFSPPARTAVEAVRKRFGLSRPFLLQVGPFEPRRGVGLSVRATRAIRADFPDIELVLAGVVRGHLPGLEPTPDHLRQLGRVTDSELAALYGAAEMVLAPSLGEGFDFPVLEALACGAAVVASDIPVHLEHYSAAVEFFTSGNADSLAQACTRVLTDSSRLGALHSEGPQLASRFTWAKSAAQHAALWRQVAGRPASAAT